MLYLKKKYAWYKEDEHSEIPNVNNKFMKLPMHSCNYETIHITTF